MSTDEWLEIDSNTGDTWLHKAAKAGECALIPGDLFTQENLMLKNNRGNTLLHFAEQNGPLTNIPQGVLCAENLLVRNNQSVTPLHMLGFDGNLDELLGIDFSKYTEARRLVGEEWWEKNNLVLAAKGTLRDSNSEGYDIDIF